MTQHRWPAVDRLPAAVAHPSQPARSERVVQRTAGEADPQPPGSQSVGTFEHLDDCQIAVYLEYKTVAAGAVPDLQYGELVPADPVNVPEH